MTREESSLLLRQARGGSPQALGELYQRYGARLLAIIRLRMGPGMRGRVESRDILQAALLKSFQRFEQFAGGDGSTMMAWLARIAENEIRDQADYQHRQRRDIAAGIALEDLPRELPAQARSALTQAVLSEEWDRVERALEMLSPEHREVIVLRKLEELSFKEVAARLSRSEDACRMLLARALAALTLTLRGLR